MVPVEFGQRMQEKAALGRGLRALEQDQPGLMTLPRLRDLFAAGEITLEEYESGVDRLLRREEQAARRAQK